MFQRILVPLDGSDRAEQAIATAANLARVSGGSILLLQVVNPDITRLETPGISMGTIDAEIERAKQYLAMIATCNILSGISVTTEVLAGDPALTIFPAAHAHQADLIIICSHGSTGARRWGIGSVSQKVARCSPLPVLILREGAGVPTNLHPGGVRSVRVQVALDGSPLAETALLPAAQLRSIGSGSGCPPPGACPPTRDIGRSDHWRARAEGGRELSPDDTRTPAYRGRGGPQVADHNAGRDEY